MAATYETSFAPSSQSFTVGGGPATVAFDAGTGANRVLLVFVSFRDQATDTTGITYNGVAMTAAGAKVSSGAGGIAGHLFYLAGPASGSNTISVAYSTSGTSAAYIAAWVANGGDQTTPVDGYASNSATAQAGANVVSSVTVTSATDDRVAVFFSQRNDAGTFTATPTNYTERQEADNGVGVAVEHGDADGAASIAASATWNNGTGVNMSWVALGINVNAAAGGPAPLSVSLGEPVIGGSIF